MVALQISDVIRARFVSLPEMSPGSGSSETVRYPIRKGTVVYMHPKGRYLVAECKGVRESFFPEDVEVL